MNRRLKIAALFGLLAAGAVQTAHAVELKATPVRDAMVARLAADDWKDDAKPKDAKPVDTVSGEQSQYRRKSVVKAAVLSAVIPGAGEYYLGNRSKAKYFFITEAATWIGFISFRTYASWKKDDFIRYADVYANAQLEGKSDDFHDMVGFYSSIDEYNSFGRVFDPERPYLYDTPENHWRWQTDEARATYRSLKNSSREALRRSEFMIGVAIVARVISIADAIRDGVRHNKRVESEFGRSDKVKLEFAIDPFNPVRQATVTLYTPF